MDSPQTSTNISITANTNSLNNFQETVQIHDKWFHLVIVVFASCLTSIFLIAFKSIMKWEKKNQRKQVNTPNQLLPPQNDLCIVKDSNTPQHLPSRGAPFFFTLGLDTNGQSMNRLYKYPLFGPQRNVNNSLHCTQQQHWVFFCGCFYHYSTTRATSSAF